MSFVELIDSRLDTAPFKFFFIKEMLLLLLQTASFTVKEFDARSCEWHSIG